MIGMNFDVKSNNVYVATNSIKPVIIREESDFDFFLDMPEGDGKIASRIMNLHFETFDEAKRWAEAYVGFTMPMGELIASA
jgi:hypothetical protein